MRLVTVAVITWLILSFGLMAKYLVSEDGPDFFSSNETSDGTTISPDLVNHENASREIASEPTPTTSPVDTAIKQIDVLRRTQIVEDALLNGNRYEPRREARARLGDDQVIFWRDAEPYNVKVTFLRSAFPRAAAGVLGPFCDNVIEYQLSLFDGRSPENIISESEPVPVRLGLSCQRGELSKNKWNFREVPDRHYLIGQWAFVFDCNGEQYSLNAEFRSNDGPRWIGGRVTGLRIDGIEDNSSKRQMQASRDRETGATQIEWNEDDRDLHSSDNRFLFVSEPTNSSSPKMSGQLLVSQTGRDHQACGNWSASKLAVQ